MTAEVIMGGDEARIQKRLDEFFEDHPDIEIKHILQSSAGNSSYGFQTTLTIFYTTPIY